MKQVRRAESGNVLWFILAGIALLAALTLTVGRSSDTSEQTGEYELAQVQASQILRYARGLAETVNQMQSRNISANDLSFDVTGLTGYANANCTVDKCKIFKTAGGGQSYEAPRTDWLDRSKSALSNYGSWIITGKTCVLGVGDESEDIATDCAGDGNASNEDLVLFLPYVSKDLCMELNNKLGVSNPSGAPPADTDDMWAAAPQFTGTFTDDSSIGLNDATLYRKPAACVEGAGTPPAGSYAFYMVLVER